MKIGTKFQIVSDALNVTVQERLYNKKQGVHYWSNIAYFSTPKHALKFIVDNEIMGAGLDDFVKVIEEIDKLYKLIEGLNTKHLSEDLKHLSEALQSISGGIDG